MNNTSIQEIIKQHNILICVGSGGVGKTTTSAAIGILAAQMGLRVLVMTIDPSQRLKVALGVESVGGRIVTVPDQQYKGQLSALLLDANQIFREFIEAASKYPEQAHRLLNNRLYQQLSTTLSGSQEFTSLLQLSKIINENKFDLIILDTPPAQHAVDFLEAPEKINALFQDNIVRWFLEDDDIGVLRKIVYRGTRMVMGALESITGSVFMRELHDFFSSVRIVQGQIESRTEAVRAILRDSRTGFLLVTGFDRAKLIEAAALNEYLAGREHNLVATLINRAYPKWEASSEALVNPILNEASRNWAAYLGQREIIYNEYAQEWQQKLPVVRIPELNENIGGLKGLEVIANEVDRAFRSIVDTSGLQSRK